MKTKLDSISRLILIAIMLFSIMAFTSVYKLKRGTVKVNVLKPEKVKITTTIDSSVLPEIVIKDHQLFLNDLGHQESGNRYSVVNRYGYMGRYQFGKSTLKTLKIRASRSKFLKDTLLQEQAMFALLKHNKKRLQKLINKFDGKVVHGVLVTESGLLAAAHLGGQGSVKKWFRSGRVRKDGNGVRITTYMRKFGGYTLNL
jgi:hypothetical protein